MAGNTAATGVLMFEKLRERELYSHPKNAPKTGTEEYAKWTWNRPDLLNFPKAPCHWLCERPGLTRFHFTCLTCWTRRMTFHTRRSKNLRQYKTIMMIMYPPKGKWFALPDNYLSYGIILPTNERGLVNPVKAGIVKVLMTIAERIAEF
jgi:hypothetical protein